MKTAMLIVVLMCAMVSGGQQGGLFVPAHKPEPGDRFMEWRPNTITGRVERLNDEEYNRLESLRKQLRDAEVEVVKVHGVRMELDACHQEQLRFHPIICLEPALYPERWEIRGQWLLVNVPEAGR